MIRRLFTLALFLLLGTVLNVAVAWGCAILSPGWFGERTSLEDCVRIWEAYAPADAPSFEGPQSDYVGIGVMDSSAYVRVPAGILRVGETRAGLPLKSMRGGGAWIPPADMLYRWSIRVPIGHFSVPYRPIMVGFFLNTLFYATLLWLFIFAAYALRRLIRRKRGLCVACGYDMRHADHAACPECGAALATAMPNPLPR